jgi:hypothetical protein
MTQEEWNRKMEFILEVQARTTVTLDMHAADHAEFVAWCKRVIRELALNNKRITDWIRIAADRLERAEKEDRAAKKRHEELLNDLRRRFRTDPDKPSGNN